MGPEYHATITNPTKRGFSWLKWQVAVYVDGEKEPQAHTIVTMVKVPLGPGQTVKSRYLVGDREGGMDTIAMRQAKSRRFVLTPMLDEAKDFREQHVLTDNPFQRYKDRVDVAKTTLEEAAQVKKVAAAQ